MSITTEKSLSYLAMREWSISLATTMALTLLTLLCIKLSARLHFRFHANLGGKTETGADNMLCSLRL